jgi:DNA-binding CsgD family transcriptional regulator/tetratricopeptide (TPR) repeat protein
VTVDAEPSGLIGRDEELTAIGAMLRDSGGCGLLLVGEAGMGKSALLDAASSAAIRDGRTVLRATGVQSEARVAFAGLHQLLYRLIGSLELLAPRQRGALLAAFGHADGPPTEVFLIAIATLELLADAATGTGLLVVVDDLQWIDDPTAQVLGFVARRIASEPIALLAATRPGSDDALGASGVLVRTLRPLRPDQAERLVRSRYPDLDQRRRRWVLEHAEGNPLALVELPKAAPAGNPSAGGRIPLTVRLERSFAARVSGLTAPARSAVVVAAADDSDDFAEIAAAVTAAVPGSVADSLRPAVDAGVLVVSQAKVRFGHPLARSAVYQSADPEMRRRAHAALAQVLAEQPERRAWHLAAATLGPDETIAAELERAAVSAGRRGAGMTSVAAWEQAATLTPQPERRGQRLLRAAELSLALGQAEQANDLAARAEPLPHTRADQARLALIRDALDPGVPGDPLRVCALADLAAEMIDAGHTDLAFRLLMAAAVRVWAADPGPETRAYLMAATERLPVPADDPRSLSVGGFVDPVRYGDPIARRIAALRPGELDPVSAELAMSIHLVGAGEAIIAVQRAVVDGARGEGRLAALPRLLTQQAWNAIALADWQTAVPAADEAVRLASETRQPLWQAAAMTGQAMIAGMRGEAEAAGQLARRAEAIALPARISAVLCGIQLTLGVTAIGAGRYDEAFDYLLRVFDRADPSYQAIQSTWALGDLAEAAVRTGRTAQAREILAMFRPREHDSVTPWTRTALLYAAPLLASGEAAEREFGRALDAGLVRWPSYRARMLLEYGSWLRRRRRVAEARSPLRTARQICEAHGLLPWAERARQELRATGDVSEAPGAQQWAALSPQELQIAQLAAEGLSNREIGQRLYLSHRTVGSHLYRIFPKLGISSRAQLRSALVPADAPPAAER